MPPVKQDSNVTGLRIAEEASFGVLGASPIWEPFEPNEYPDFGGETIKVARNPINRSRQRKKGVVVDLNAAAGVQTDFLQDNWYDKLQGFVSADWRRQGHDDGLGGSFSEEFTAAASDVVTFGAPHGLATGDGPFFVSSDGTLPAGLTAATPYWAIVLDATTINLAASHADAVAAVPVPVDITDAGTGTHTMEHAPSVDGTANSYLVNDELSGETGFQVGNLVFAEGFANEENNGLKLVDSVTVGEVGVTDTALVDEDAAADAKLRVVGYQAATGLLDVTGPAGGNLARITSDGVDPDFTTLGISPGGYIHVGGDAAINRFSTAANNGIKRVFSVSAAFIEIDEGGFDMVDEVNTTQDVQVFLPDTLKNEADPALQVFRSYQAERTLGEDDDGPQAEYEIGCTPSTFEIVNATADKMLCNAVWVAIDEETRDGLTGLKAGSRPAIAPGDAFNTSSNFMYGPKLTLVDGTELFTYVTEFTLSWDNNIALNKAIGVLGAFAASYGDFAVSAAVTAYFTTVAAKAAIRANDDVNFAFGIGLNNKGWMFSVPLVTLGGGQNSVASNEPITVPLTVEGAAHPTFDHTLLMNYFGYLPDLVA
jgi:hypothetical protein